jgi:Phage terminase, small subunit
VNPPRGLGRDGRRAWRAGLDALDAAGVDPALTVGALERYARAADRLAHVQATWEDAGRPVTAKGSKGQVVAHPLLRELRDETRAVQQLAEALLPPQSAGWRRGTARSPDRQAKLHRRRKTNPIPIGEKAEAALRRVDAN